MNRRRHHWTRDDTIELVLSTIIIAGCGVAFVVVLALLP
jgi:hypothetical protein